MSEKCIRNDPECSLVVLDSLATLQFLESKLEGLEG